MRPVPRRILAQARPRDGLSRAFVDALTEAGYLSVLIPEEYGGAGLKLSAAAAILEEIQRAGCNGGGCHAQMYTMGTLLRHGSDEQKAKWLPKIATGELRLQAFGVTEPTSGTDTSSLKTFAKRDGNNDYIVNGQKIWTSRAEHSDLMILLGAHHAEGCRPRSAPTDCRSSSSTCGEAQEQRAHRSARSAP